MKTLSIKNVYAIGLVSLVLGILFDYLFFNQQIGISFVIYVGLLLAGLFGFLWLFKIPYNKVAAWFLPAILFFSLMVGIRDNEFLIFWNIVLTLGLLLLLAHHIVGRKISNALFLDYLKTAVILPLNMLGKALNALGRMLSVHKEAKENQKTSQVTKGILITLPIVLFFLFLLSSADLAFKRLVSDLFSFNFSLDPDAIAQIWWAVVFTFLWLGAYVYTLENSKGDEEVPLPPVTRSYKFGNIEAGILFAALNVLFLIFVGVQIKYLFAGHGAIVRLGFTYAEYAHRGFGELIAVALLTFGLIFLSERFIERNSDKPKPSFKILTGALIALVLVIMASAFTRLSVYEQAYGFTFMRMLVQAFIVWLAAVFLWLSYKIIRGTGDRPFVFGIFLSVIAFFAVLNLLNPDAFVARKNFEHYQKTGKIDALYFQDISADALPTILEKQDVVTGEQKESLTRMLQSKKDSLEEYQNNPWQSYNYSKSKASRLLGN